MKYDPFVYGKHQGENVVSVEPETVGGKSFMNIWYEGKELPTQRVEVEHYVLFAQNYTGDMMRLQGDLHYGWAQKFDNKKDYQTAVAIAKAQGWDFYRIYNDKEAFMVKTGVTYYKGMSPKDVSVLSFDIETTGLDASTNTALMISNTFRSNAGTVERRLFSIDEFNSEKEMIYAWCSYVCDRNPSILLGHNVFGFDLPFLRERLGKELPIGRMQSRAKTARYTSQFRKDGSQSYDYTNVLVPGREIIDTFHLAIKFDTERAYPSYGLKAIIKHEGLEREDRQHFDASKIGTVYDALQYERTEAIRRKMTVSGEQLLQKKWEEIKEYAKHDADDSLTLFDLMIPSYFYYCQHIPKTMQQVVNSATGSQVNSFMVRAYLSEGHSLPAASETFHYEGGVSFGYPGIYNYVAKVDVASLYPSIILEHKVYNKDKDPKGYFLKMVKYFTDERLGNKAKAKETGERHYKDLSDAQKIVINSAYGFLGAPGLLFNSPQHAAVITERGRSILHKGILWADKKQFTIVNADTDSFSFTTGNKFYPPHFKEWIKELNKLFPDQIRWEDDGTYRKVIVVKAKNYVLQDGPTGKITLKGSALKATMKEPALQEFIKRTIGALLEDKNGDLRDIYQDYVRDIHSIDADSIRNWASKKTVTKAVLNPKRTNESRIKEAIQRAQKVVSEGDKIHVYFKEETELALVETFDGVYSKKKLLGKLFKTAEIFKSILPMDDFPNLALKQSAELLDKIVAPSQDRETNTQQGA